MSPPDTGAPWALAGLPARLFWTLLLITALAASTFDTADRQAADWAGRSLERALITFAAARALNGAISVAQSTEVAIQPAGVGVAVEPGQLLDPVNDLIERFSWVMLTASASLGVQLIMVEFSQHALANLLVASLIGVALVLLWLPLRPAQLARWVPALRGPTLRLALTAIVLRFAVTLVALASNAAGEFALADREADRLATVQRASAQVEASADTPATDAEPSWWDGAREQFDMLAGARQRLENLRNDVEAATRAIVDMIAMYTLQTILLPLLFSWLVVAALRRIWR